MEKQVRKQFRSRCCIKDTHRENAPSNETPTQQVSISINPCTELSKIQFSL